MPIVRARRPRCPWLSVLLVGLLAPPASGATRTVAGGGGADHAAIQPAIDASSAGDTVVVKPGEYVIASPITFRGKAVVVRAEAGPEPTVIRMSSSPADPARSSVVVFESGESPASVLDGFTLTGGGGTGVAGGLLVGGGLLCLGTSSPTILGCRVTDNRAEDGGGLGCVDRSSPRVQGCAFVHNEGPGISVGGASRASFEDCDVTSGSREGALVGGTSTPTFLRCRFRENAGMGFVSQRGSHPLLAGCEVCWNAADGVMGDRLTIVDSVVGQNGSIGINLYDSTLLTVSSSTVFGNNGPGITCWNSSAIVENCVIYGNHSAGILSASGSSVTARSCTLADNNWSAPEVERSGDSAAALVNCIAWNPRGGPPDVTTTSCLVGEDPRFVTVGTFVFARFRQVEMWGEAVDIPDTIAVQPDYHLSPSSPAIDRGAYAGSPPADRDGFSRPSGAAVDIGAYEHGDTTGDIVVDDGRPSTWSRGTWYRSSAPAPFGSGSVYSKDAGASYTFLTPVPAAGRYEVSLWWTAWPSRLSSVPVAVRHASGSDTVEVDQLGDGGRWNPIGTWDFQDLAAVTIVSEGVGSTCADAMRLSLSGPSGGDGALVLDNGEPGTSATGYWPVSGAPDPYGGDSVYSKQAGARYTFAFDLPSADTCEVYLWWTAYSSRLTNVPVEIRHSGGTTRVFVNQKFAGGAWNSVGRYAFGATAQVTIVSQGVGSTCADAVKLVPASLPPGPFERVVDDGQPGTTEVGVWPRSGGSLPYGDGSLYSNQAGALYLYDLAVPGPGDYEVYLWWTEYPSRRSAVPVAVHSGEGITRTVVVDQSRDGGRWNSLGTVAATQDTVTVTIYSRGDGSTCADAARIVKRD